MLSFMLCGAGDTAEVHGAFVELADRLGFEPWSYLDGTIRYRHSAAAGWRENSRGSVLESDIAVFVVLERHGQIAWTEEFPEAIQAGLPFLVLCLDSTLARFREAQLATTSNHDELMLTLAELEQRHQVTIVPFELDYFAITLQHHLTMLLEQAASALRQRNARELERTLVLGGGDLTPNQLDAVLRIVRDEFEDKNLRKRGLTALLRHGAIDGATVVALVGSIEQGVARVMLAMVPKVIDQVSDEDLAALVEIVNQSDDVGMRRRLAISLGEIDCGRSLTALVQMQITEVGTARRVLLGLSRRDPSGLTAAQRRALREVIVSCRDYKATTGGIKDLASEVLERFGLDEDGAG